MPLAVGDSARIDMYVSMYGPEYESDEKLPLFIEEASESVDSAYFGGKVDKAIALLALHNLCLSKQGASAGGVVVSKTIGPVSVRFAEPRRNGLHSYALTKFGMMYSDLVKSCGCGVSVTFNGRLA